MQHFLFFSFFISCIVLMNKKKKNSWGSGANPWGPDKDDRFSPPNHYDGLLEIVGVTGVVHLGQIQSGIRYATRIAQVCIYLNKNLLFYLRHVIFLFKGWPY